MLCSGVLLGIPPLAVCLLLTAYLVQRISGNTGNLFQPPRVNGVVDLHRLVVDVEEADLAAALVLVGLGEEPRVLLVVAFNGFERLVRNTIAQKLRGRTDERVAVLDVRVQETQRLSGLQRLQPQRDLGQLHRHRVEVHPVDAARHHLVHRRADSIHGRLGVTLPHRGDLLGDPPRRRHQEMPGPTGRVADGQLQQLTDDRLGFIRLACRARLNRSPLDRLFDDRVQRGIQQRLDQRRRRVIRPRRLTVVARQLHQLEAPLSGAVLGHQLQQRLVDRTQLVGVQVPVVHRAPPFGSRVTHLRQVPDSPQQRIVGQLQAPQRSISLSISEQPAQPRQSELGPTVHITQGIQHDLQRPVLIAVRGTPTAARVTTQPLG